MTDINDEKDKYKEILKITIEDIIENYEILNKTNKEIEEYLNYNLDKNYPISFFKEIVLENKLLYVFLKHYNIDRFKEVISIYNKILQEREV